VSLTAIVLILTAAVAHASWNLFSKQAAAGGAVCFVWLFFTVGAVLYAPVAAIVLVVSHPRLAGLPVVFMAGTAIIHIGYALLLQNGYRLGDLSVVYPIGRGSGALLAAAAGIVLLGERPGPLSTAGILLVIAGVIVIGLPGRTRTGITAPSPSPPALMGIAFALLTGLTIAAYTVWDKYAVATLHIPPVLEDWAATLGVTLAVAPIALRDRARLAAVWHSYRPQVLGAAVLSPLAYILVLTALRFTAISVAAPSREVSVLFGVLLGRRMLGEGSAARRLAAALAIVAGIISVAIS
jgi:drug/metabolite transporter (DMT)-like permease